MSRQSNAALAADLRRVAKLASEAGSIALAQAEMGLAASLEKGRLSAEDAAKRLDDHLLTCAQRVKALEAFMAELRSVAAACRKAGAS